MNRFLNLGNPLPLLRAFKYSYRGLAYAVRHERAFLQEIILLIIAIVAAFLLTDSPIERAVLIGSVAFALVVELINSAIETTIDRIGPEHHPLSQRAKDLGSAAVLIALLTSAGIWLIVLL
jgi:diacylglycerol kinase (ATP)